MRRIAVALAVVCVCAAASERAASRDLERFDELVAETLEYDNARQMWVARGAAGEPVRVRRGDATLQAEWMAFSERTRRGIASGNVVYEEGDDTLYADFVQFDLDTLRGVLFDGRFESEGDQFRLEGAVVRRTGEDTYQFEDGTFTTCRCPGGGRDPWTIEADEADLEVGGYGTARNTTFEILGVPVVWLPWMLYPLKTERETGLLFPEIARSGRNGLELGLPVFFAVGDPVNVTLTPSWLQRRGPKGDAEVEYVFGENSWGELSGAFLKDFLIEENTISDPFGDERWYTAGRHRVHAPGGLDVLADYRFASDNQYPIDFDDLRDFRSFRYLESSAFVTRGFGGTGRFGVSAGARFADDLQSPDDLDRDRALLQRLPEVHFAALPSPLPWVSFLAPSLDVHYASFQPTSSAQEGLSSAALGPNGAFFDTGIDGVANSQERFFAANDPDGDGAPGMPGSSEADGIFQEGEPLADRGHRVVLHPRLALPFRLFDLVELLPEVGWHQTFYDSNQLAYEQRGYLTARADLRTRLRGGFGSVVHVLEPRLGWALVAATNQKGNPLFVPGTAVPQRRIRQLSLENLTRDPSDRVEDANALTFGFGNTLFRGGALVADFVLQGGFEFNEGDFLPVVLDGRAYPTERSQVRFNVAFDPMDVALDEAYASVAWADRRGDSLTVGYRFLRRVPEFFEDFSGDDGRFDEFDRDFDQVNQLGVGLRVALPWRFTASWDTAYTFERSLFLQNTWGIEYLSRCLCWVAGLEISQSRSRGVQFALIYRLTGLGDDRRRRGPGRAWSARSGGPAGAPN